MDLELDNALHAARNVAEHGEGAMLGPGPTRLLLAELDRLRAERDADGCYWRGEARRLREIVQSHDGPGHDTELANLSAEVDRLRREVDRREAHELEAARLRAHAMRSARFGGLGGDRRPVA